MFINAKDSAYDVNLRKARVFSEAHRKKLAEARKFQKTKPCSEETKRKISEANKGRVLCKDTTKISKALKGRVFTEEHRRKISQAKIGGVNNLLRFNQERTKNALRYQDKTVKEWALILGCSRSNIREHLKTHGHLNNVRKKVDK